MAKKNKVKKTPKQKAKKAGKVILIIFVIIAILVGAAAIANTVVVKSSRNFIAESIKPINYEAQLEPTADGEEGYTFVTDNDFKVVQLTDVHIGSGFMCAKNDSMAINAVAAMVTAEKPDLVIVTGDVAYPVPFQAGTFNNRPGALTFAELMEKLGVYWALAFGNHDTEAYSYFSREDIAKLYENKEKYPHCLFRSGPEEVSGVGNYIIKVKNSQGQITQAFFILDSHSYTDGDYFGIQWKYDAIHEDQVNWYKDSVSRLTQENGGVTPKSLAFFHIPLIEMREAYNEYRDAGFKDTDSVKYICGKAGESNLVVYSSNYNYGMFSAFKNSGSTQGIFFGHDHLNNISFDYKGVRMTYGYSIDYLAYTGIAKFGLQRGCTVITVKPDGSFDYTQENYYQDKYQPAKAKEEVDLEHEMNEVASGGTNPFAGD